MFYSGIAGAPPKTSVHSGTTIIPDWLKYLHGNLLCKPFLNICNQVSPVSKDFFWSFRLYLFRRSKQSTLSLSLQPTKCKLPPAEFSGSSDNWQLSLYSTLQRWLHVAITLVLFRWLVVSINKKILNYANLHFCYVIQMLLMSSSKCANKNEALASLLDCSLL